MDGTLCRTVASHWNGLEAKPQREHLKELEASLEAALAKGFVNQSDTATEREDIAADLKAVSFTSAGCALPLEHRWSDG